MIGGKVLGGKRDWGAENKICLFGMIENGGKVKVTTVGGRTREILLPIIGNSVVEGSMIHTDKFEVYRSLKSMGFEHKTVNYSSYEWKRIECHTYSIEGFWSNLKKLLLGTYTQDHNKYLWS